MDAVLSAALHRVGQIRASGLTIYDLVAVGDPHLWFPTRELAALLNARLRGLDLADLPIRTRSKVTKGAVCEALGYEVPDSFKRTRPRFPGQQLDVYVQKANNLQIWNDELEATRRYALVRVDAASRVTCVRVVSGAELALLDTTGTLTQKYQARATFGDSAFELASEADTEPLLRPGVLSTAVSLSRASPTGDPQAGSLLPIRDLADRLMHLIGQRLRSVGADQERARGENLHRLVTGAIGYRDFGDSGQFPDVRHQLLEVKLQTSPTIDLGLVSPDSTSPIDVARVAGHQPRHCDVRYAVFGGVTDGRDVQIRHLVMVTGERFLVRFARFRGRVLNMKLQIPLPNGFFA